MTANFAADALKTEPQVKEFFIHGCIDVEENDKSPIPGGGGERNVGLDESRYVRIGIHFKSGRYIESKRPTVDECLNECWTLAKLPKPKWLIA